MKILVACRSFDKMAGGVERMAVAMMNEMRRRGHDVGLLTWDGDHAVPFYDLDPRIEWRRLALGDPAHKAGWGIRLRRALNVRRFVKAARPDIMIGFQHGTWLALRLFTMGLRIPTVAAERNAPHRFEFLEEGKRRRLIYLSFLMADRITIQCESYRGHYPAFLRTRIVTISNPVFPASSRADPAGDSAPQKTLLCVGRLSYQKHQAVLIRAFAALVPDFPDWRLVLAGEGEDRPALEREIAVLEMENRISLPGAISAVVDLYAASHLFCLPSRWEGFPNALAEAMAHGLPVTGFSECAGVRDLVQDDGNGLLASGNGDEAALAEILRLAMADSALRQRLGQAAAQTVHAYAPDTVFNRWENLFRALAKP
jgi:glycosyltransferase involved in cell wall biosynthesis